MESKIVTLKKLKEFASISQAIEWALNSDIKGNMLERPRKPILTSSPTSKDAEKFHKDLLEYEKLQEQYDFNRIEIKKKRSAIENIVIEFIKDESGLNTIPEQYRDKVYGKAYEDGHSSGYYEVYLKLNSLIEIFD